MATNTDLIEVKDRGWINGLGTLWRKENHRWWGTGSWLVKVLVWMAVIDGLMAFVVYQPGSGNSGEPLEQAALMTYFLLASTLPTFAIIILGQDAVIDERNTGTAAWVLTKPASRAAFLLSKLASQSLSTVATMVLAQGAAAYFILKSSGDIKLSLPGFLAGMGLVSLFLVCVVALALMLGCLVRSRGQLVGLSTLFVSSNVLLPLAVPAIGKALPSYIFFTAGSGQHSLAEILAMGQPLPTLMPVISTLGLIILFTWIALTTFEREEF